MSVQKTKLESVDWGTGEGAKQVEKGKTKIILVSVKQKPGTRKEKFCPRTMVLRERKKKLVETRIKFSEKKLKRKNLKGEKQVVKLDFD